MNKQIFFWQSTILFVLGYIFSISIFPMPSENESNTSPYAHTRAGRSNQEIRVIEESNNRLWSSDSGGLVHAMGASLLSESGQDFEEEAADKGFLERKTGKHFLLSRKQPRKQLRPSVTDSRLEVREESQILNAAKMLGKNSHQSSGNSSGNSSSSDSSSPSNSPYALTPDGSPRKRASAKKNSPGHSPLGQSPLSSPRNWFKKQLSRNTDVVITQEGCLNESFMSIVGMLCFENSLQAEEAAGGIVDVVVSEPGMGMILGWAHGQFAGWSKAENVLYPLPTIDHQIVSFCLTHDNNCICIGTRSNELLWYDMRKMSGKPLARHAYQGLDCTGNIVRVEGPRLLAETQLRPRLAVEGLICAQKTLGVGFFTENGRETKMVESFVRKRLQICICSAFDASSSLLAYAMGPRSLYENRQIQGLYGDNASISISAVAGRIFVYNMMLGSEIDSPMTTIRDRTITSLEFITVQQGLKKLLIGDDRGSIILTDYESGFGRDVLVQEDSVVGVIKRMAASPDGRFVFFIADQPDVSSLYLVDVNLKHRLRLFKINTAKLTALACTEDANSYYIVLGVSNGQAHAFRVYKPYNLSASILKFIAHADQGVEAQDLSTIWTTLPSLVRDRIEQSWPSGN